MLAFPSHDRPSRLNWLRMTLGAPLVYYSGTIDNEQRCADLRRHEAERSKRLTVDRCLSFSHAYRRLAIKRAGREA